MKKIIIAFLMLLLVAQGAFAQQVLCDDTIQTCAIANDLSVGEDIVGQGTATIQTSNGAYLQFVQLNGTATGTGATISASNLIPEGTVVMGCVARVTTAFSGSGLTTFTIGDGSDADKWGALIALTAGTKTTSDDFTAAGPTLYTSNTSVVLTGTGGNFAAGAARISCFGYKVVGPTS